MAWRKAGRWRIGELSVNNSSKQMCSTVQGNKGMWHETQESNGPNHRKYIFLIRDQWHQSPYWSSRQNKLYLLKSNVYSPCEGS